MNSSINRIAASVFGALTVTSVFAGELSGIRADSLLSVDQNRAEIVEGLVSKWKDHLAAGKEKDLKQTLMGLRADKLLAVSLAQDQKQFAALLEKDSFLPLKSESPAEAGGQGGVAHAKAVGEVNKDVLYTPITPCRVFDTRPANPLVAGAARAFETRGALNAQGGAAAGCGIPNGAVSVMMQLTNEFPPGAGFLIGGAEGTAGGGIMVYAAGSQITVSTAMPLNTTNGRFALLANNANTQLIGDVVGYFAAPSAGNGLRVVQTTGTYTDAPNIINGSANNSASGQGATVAGGGFAGTCVDMPTGGSRPCGNRALADFSTVSGGEANTASGVEATVAGGGRNTASATRSTVGGGVNNTASGNFSTAAGGFTTTASGESSAVGGGSNNTASGLWSTVAGGISNDAIGREGTVGGGGSNNAIGGASTVSGGSNNTASGPYSTIPGGFANTASGEASFAAGRATDANQNSCFVFGGWSTAGVGRANCLGVSNVARFALDHGMSIEYFAPRPDGGGQRWVHFGDLVPSQTIATWNGAFLSDGGVWTNTSDRNLKENFSRIDPKQMLAKVMALPVTAWNYKAESAGTRHIGPMAQDFKRLFGVGNDDTSIGTVDASGVALAAIQGLHQMVNEKNAKIDKLERANKVLQEELASIKRKLGL